MVYRRDEWFKWLLLLVLALIWGSSFILMKRGLYHEGVPVLTPWQLASARLAIAWLALSPVLIVHFPLFRKYWVPLLATGVLGNGIPAVLFAVAQSRIDSSLSGALNSLTPLFTLLVGVLFFARRLRGFHMVGTMIGLFGALGLILWKQADGLPTWSIYAFLPILGTVCYGASANIVKHYLYGLPAVATAALALSFVGPLGIIGVFASGLPHALNTVPHAWSSLGHVAILAVFSSALSMVLWNALLKRTSAVWASSVTYLMPVVALAWGFADGEHMTVLQGGMIALILCGVYLVSLAERKTDP